MIDLDDADGSVVIDDRYLIEDRYIVTPDVEEIDIYGVWFDYKLRAMQAAGAPITGVLHLRPEAGLLVWEIKNQDKTTTVAWKSAS